MHPTAAPVILHHTAIVYGGSGGWYWREQPNASNPVLLLFNALNQSYFMGFFFLLAAGWTFPALGKFVLVGAFATAGSFLAGACLRRLPGATRIL